MKFKLVESKEDWEKLKKHLETRDYTDPPTYIDLFKKMKDRLPKEERDIYYWLKKDPYDFEDRLDKLARTLSKTQEKHGYKKEGAKLITQNEFYSVYEILNKDASCYYGKGTKWCISGDIYNEWERYRNEDFYFLIRHNPKNDKWDKIAVKINNRGDVTFYDSLDHSYNILPRILKPELKTMPQFDEIKLLDYISSYTKDDLDFYEKMRDDGFITDDEFERIKETSDIDNE